MIFALLARPDFHEPEARTKEHATPHTPKRARYFVLVWQGVIWHVVPAGRLVGSLNYKITSHYVTRLAHGSSTRPAHRRTTRRPHSLYVYV